MIIACPACTTRYAVPDSAIGVEGRTVRCAKCRHSWFQDGPGLAHIGAADTAPPVATAPVTPAPADNAQPQRPAASIVEAPIAAVSDIAPSSGDPPLPRATGLEPPAVRPRTEPADAVFDDAHSSFEHAPPFRPRRNPARLWTMAAAIFAVIALGAVWAVSHYGLPDWVPFAAKSAFAEAQPDLTLDFPSNRQDRRTLPDGTQFFGVSGTITNVGKERRSVPTVLILLRDEHDRVVYSWEVAPPKRVLAPGENEAVIEAVTDIPRSAKFAEIGWKPS